MQCKFKYIVIIIINRLKFSKRNGWGNSVTITFNYIHTTRVNSSDHHVDLDAAVVIVSHSNVGMVDLKAHTHFVSIPVHDIYNKAPRQICVVL